MLEHMASPGVKKVSIFIGSQHVDTCPPKITVVNHSSDSNVGVQLVDHPKLHGDQQEGSQKGERATLPQPVERVERDTKLISNLCHTLQVGVEVMVHLDKVRWHTVGKEEVTYKVKVERIEKLVVVNRGKDEPCLVEDGSLHFSHCVPRSIRGLKL